MVSLWEFQDKINTEKKRDYLQLFGRESLDRARDRINAEGSGCQLSQDSLVVISSKPSLTFLLTSAHCEVEIIIMLMYEQKFGPPSFRLIHGLSIIPCYSLVLIDIRTPIIGPFRAWKPTILMP